MQVLTTYLLDYTLKTCTPVEDGDSTLKLLQGVSHPEIQLGAGIYPEFSLRIKTFVPEGNPNTGQGLLVLD